MKKDLGGALKRKVMVLSRVSTGTKPEVPLFVLKVLQFSFNWHVAQEGNEAIRECGIY